MLTLEYKQQESVGSSQAAFIYPLQSSPSAGSANCSTLHKLHPSVWREKAAATLPRTDGCTSQCTCYSDPPRLQAERNAHR